MGCAARCHEKINIIIDHSRLSNQSPTFRYFHPLIFVCAFVLRHWHINLVGRTLNALFIILIRLLLWSYELILFFFLVFFTFKLICSNLVQSHFMTYYESVCYTMQNNRHLYNVSHCVVGFAFFGMEFKKFFFLKKKYRITWNAVEMHWRMMQKKANIKTKRKKADKARDSRNFHTFSMLIEHIFLMHICNAYLPASRQTDADWRTNDFT